MSATSEQPAVSITESYAFTAPAEVVYGVLTDPDRVSRWLPRGMHTTSATPGEIRIQAGGSVHRYAVRLVPDRLELTWDSADQPGLHGRIRVADAPAGGSVVHADLTVPAAVAGETHVRDLVAETAGHLGRDVDDNFNAG